MARKQIDPSIVQSLIDALINAKPEEGTTDSAITQTKALAMMRASIVQARANGCSFAQIAKMLKDGGMPAEEKSLLRAVRKVASDASKKTVKKPRKAQSISPSEKPSKANASGEVIEKREPSVGAAVPPLQASETTVATTQVAPKPEPEVVRPATSARNEKLHRGRDDV